MNPFGARGKHRGSGRFGRAGVVAIVSAGIVVVLATAAFAGYTYDRAKAETVLPGVHVAGVPIGGMTRAQAAAALAPAAARELNAQIVIQAGPKQWTMTPRELGATIDVQQAVNQALAVSNSLSWPSRVYHRLLGRPVAQNLKMALSVDPTVVTQFAQRMANEVFLQTQDATVNFTDGELVFRHAQRGMKLNKQQAAGAILEALKGGTATVTVPVKRTKPKVTDKNIGSVIVVRLSQEKLYLYDNMKLVKSYSVATGQPAYPTPTGRFEIITKEVNPTWINPARNTWGAGEPAEIAPGPGNPLGTRAMALSAPGILIHGTPEDWSIGHPESHGCIRMHMWDVEDLFPRVEVGTPVIIAY